MKTLFDAFISYGRADSKAFATKLHARLVEEDLKIWFDQNDIPLGVDYQNQIDDGIEKAHNFLFIIAPHSVNSPYCLKEILLALKRNKRIIPLLQVEQISRETWQQRNPNGTTEDWEAYKAKGLHTSFQNMHPTISKINWVYFREGIDEFEAAFTGLMSLIRRQADYVEQHTRFLAKALEWERYQKQTSYLLIGEERQQAEAWLKIRFKDEQPPCTPSDLHCEFITESIKNANNLMTQVFLSYADADRTTMELLRNSLRRESITVWTNKSDIQTGEAFEEAIKRGIEQADNVVYLRSPDSVNLDYCQKELEYALSLHKRIIPVLVRETDSQNESPALRSLQYIDLTDNVKEEDYLLDESQLLRILRQDAAYYNEHKILLVKALKWKRQHDNLSILLRGYNLRHAETWLKLAKLRTQHLPTSLQEEFITESLRQPPANSLNVFISYSRADSDFARNLNDALQIQGKTTWFDQESIAWGSDFQQEIYRGIKACDNFLFILSPQSVNSPYCASEVEYAAQLNKRFVTLLHREVNPKDLHPELAKVQWIDFNQNERDFNANFNQLVRTLDTDREHVHSHTKWLQRAIEWKENNQSADLLLRGSELVIAENWLQETELHNKQPQTTDLQKAFITASKEFRDHLLRQEEERRQHDLEQERKARKAAQTRNRVAAISIVVLTGLTIFAFNQRRKAEQQSVIALTQTSEAFLALRYKQLEALVAAVQAGRLLKDAHLEQADVLNQTVVGTLQHAVYKVQERNRLLGHGGDVNSVSFSPDGKTLASGSEDNTIKLWSLDGRELHTLTGHGGVVRSVSFSPDGKTLASGSEDNTIKLWSLDGQVIKTFRGHGSAVRSVSFSPDGKTLASGSEDNTIKLWSLDGQVRKTLRGHGDAVNSASFSPDGKILVSGSEDNTIKLWSLDGQVRKTLRGHGGSGTSVSFSPDGKTFASTGWDGAIRLRSLNGLLLQEISAHNDKVYSLSFSTDGKTLSSGSGDNTIKLWSLSSQLKTLTEHNGTVTSASFSPDGKTLASGSEDNTLKLWSWDGQVLHTLSGHSSVVTSVSFSPDGKTLASGSKDKTIKLWSLDSQEPKTLSGHSDTVTSISFSPDGKTLASGSKDKTIKLWSLNGRVLHTLSGHDDAVTSVSFSPDGKTLASGSKDKTIKLWSLDSQEPKTLGKQNMAVNSVSFSPDGKTLASASDDATIKLWSLDGQEHKTPLIGQRGAVTSISFSPDGKTLASGSRDNTIQLWSLDGQELSTLTGHGGAVTSVSFSPDGKTLTSASEDQTLILWNLNVDDLLVRGCNSLHDYLRNPNNHNDMRQLCDGIGTSHL